MKSHLALSLLLVLIIIFIAFLFLLLTLSTTTLEYNFAIIYAVFASGLGVSASVLLGSVLIAWRIDELRRK